MPKPRALFAVAGCCGLLLHLAGKASSPEAFVAAWNAEAPRRVACKAAGEIMNSRESEAKLGLTMALQSEVYGLDNPDDLRKMIADSKKKLFKWRLDDQVKRTNPDSALRKQLTYKKETARKLLNKMLRKEEKANQPQVKIPTYTEWMETHIDLERQKQIFTRPGGGGAMFSKRLRDGNFPITIYSQEMRFKNKFERKYGYRYDRDTKSFPGDRWGDKEEHLDYAEFVKKGGTEWWAGQKKIHGEESRAKSRASRQKRKEENSKWKQLWADEAEVRRKELGQTE